MMIMYLINTTNDSNYTCFGQILESQKKLGAYAVANDLLEKDDVGRLAIT